VHLGGQILKLTGVFKSTGKNKNKIEEKREFYTTYILEKLLDIVVTLKQITHDSFIKY